MWRKHFLLQAAIVLAAMSYARHEGERYFLIPAAAIVALACVLYLVIFLRWRRAQVAEHRENCAGLKTKQPWEPQK
jgi:membrane protein YdbS with pleckstrin-like domain